LFKVFKFRKTYFFFVANIKTKQLDNQFQKKSITALDSPNRQRIRLLADKWTHITHNIDKEKVERKDVLEDRLHELEERINKERPNDE
jgi:hypothetical protein